MDRSLVKNTFGAEIRKARKNEGITLDELSYRTGLDVKHLGRLENGGKLMSVQTLTLLFRELDFSCDAIMDKVIAADTESE